MPAQKILPSSDVLKKHRQQDKMTYEQIAEKYGVTKGAVYLALQQAGLTGRRPSYKHLLPWTVAQAHANAHPALMLRVLGARQAKQEVPEVKLGMLERWLEEIKAADVVVCYDRDMPPNPASPSTGGFYYSKRRKEDGPFPEDVNDSEQSKALVRASEPKKNPRGGTGSARPAETAR
ncbi:hypothetical protein [Streptomyces sp. DH10]|uniref:hypothetical protein n=1 Tax=Streptomyces sp. DH10 TaxID=3040121 RepID=UPI002442F6DB|nr:hypothetical protein [Streptomyces sp. DH10]MDG9711121.1 hypothetical protein [Streptomyces sp. DH10]